MSDSTFHSGVPTLFPIRKFFGVCMSARRSCRCRSCRTRARLTIERREHLEVNGRATRNPRYVRTDSAFGGIYRGSIGVSESRPDSPVGNVLVHYRRSEIEFPRDGGAA